MNPKVKFVIISVLISILTITGIGCSKDWITKYEQDGPRVLHDAIIQMDVEGVQQLIEYGAVVNSKSGDGYNPLILAIRNYSMPIVQMLLDAGIYVDIKDNDGNTAIMYALALDPDREELTKALYYVRDLYDEFDELRQTLRGYWPPILPPANFDSPYYSLTRMEKRDFKKQIIDILIEKGADLTMTNDSGDNPISLAFQLADRQYVQTLLDHGARNPQGCVCCVVNFMDFVIGETTYDLARVTIEQNAAKYQNPEFITGYMAEDGSTDLDIDGRIKDIKTNVELNGTIYPIVMEFLDNTLSAILVHDMPDTYAAIMDEEYGFHRDYPIARLDDIVASIRTRLIESGIINDLGPEVAEVAIKYIDTISDANTYGESGNYWCTDDIIMSPVRFVHFTDTVGGEYVLLMKEPQSHSDRQDYIAIISGEEEEEIPPVEEITEITGETSDSEVVEVEIPEDTADDTLVEETPTEDLPSEEPAQE